MPLPRLFLSPAPLEWSTIAERLRVSPDTPDRELVNSPDETLTIDHVRSLVGKMAYRPLQSTVKTLVLFGVDQASTPAQNALLKSLEEYPDYIQCVLTARNLEMVLPTILSRCFVEQWDPKGGASTVHAEELPELRCYADVFSLSERYKEREDALNLVDGLLLTVHRRFQATPSVALHTTLTALLEAREQLGRNGVVRLVLEQCFLTIFSCNSSLSMSR